MFGPTKAAYGTRMYSTFTYVKKSLVVKWTTQGAAMAGLGRVPDLRVRVNVRELDYHKSTSTSASTGWWVRVRVSHMIYILDRQQYCIFQSLKRDSSDLYKYGTKLQLPIVHVNSLYQYICLTILCNLIEWHFNLGIAMYWLLWMTITTCCQFKNRKQKFRNIMKCIENSVLVFF